jgi:hypothetical protein
VLPEDGRRPKHVGDFECFSVCFLNTENISAFVGFSWKIEIEMRGATMKIIYCVCRPQWPRSVRRRSAAFRLVRL